MSLPGTGRFVAESPGVEGLTRRIFLLSPASCGGERARLVFNERARFDLAVLLRTSGGAALGST